VAIEFEKTFSVGSYLGYQGQKFVERFDANSYMVLSMAMDLFDLGRTPAELAAVLGRSACRWLFISYSSDWLFPPDQSRDMVNALVSLEAPVSYCNIRSNCGHDAFLLPDDLDRYGELMRAFLANLAGVGIVPPDEEEDTAGHSDTSIFNARRLDYDRIVELIPEGASVLDLGCGRGGLLARLKQKGHRRLVGIEYDEQAVVACVRRDVDVIHADLNKGLSPFADRQFDYVLLSQTLQAVRDVERVIDDMLRVGRMCIVSFPNMAFKTLRRMLAEEGRAPRSAGLLRYEWYNSPNIRFLSILDFEDFCRAKDIRIHRRITLDTEAGAEVFEEPNRSADLAIFVISR
jgi:homoserine O-acetyltransferase